MNGLVEWPNPYGLSNLPILLTPIPGLCYKISISCLFTFFCSVHAYFSFLLLIILLFLCTDSSCLPVFVCAFIETVLSSLYPPSLCPLSLFSLLIPFHFSIFLHPCIFLALFIPEPCNEIILVCGLYRCRDHYIICIILISAAYKRLTTQPLRTPYL